MYNIKKYNNNKATVCVKNTCATVYGEAAEIVNVIAITISVIAGALLLAKVVKSL